MVYLGTMFYLTDRIDHKIRVSTERTFIALRTTASLSAAQTNATLKNTMKRTGS